MSEVGGGYLSKYCQSGGGGGEGGTVSKEAYNYIFCSGVKREILIWGRGVWGGRNCASINSKRGGEGARGEWASYNYYYQFARVCFLRGLFLVVCVCVCLFASSGEWGGGETR